MKPKDPQETVKALGLRWHSGSARRSVWVSFQLFLMDSRGCSCWADLAKWHRSILSTANPTGKSWPLVRVLGAEQVFLVTTCLPFFFNLLFIWLMPRWTAAAGLGEHSKLLSSVRKLLRQGEMSSADATARLIEPAVPSREPPTKIPNVKPRWRVETCEVKQSSLHRVCPCRNASSNKTNGSGTAMSTWHMQFLWEFNFPSETLYFEFSLSWHCSGGKKVFRQLWFTLWISLKSTSAVYFRHLQSSTHFS